MRRYELMFSMMAIPSMLSSFSWFASEQPKKQMSFVASGTQEATRLIHYIQSHADIMALCGGFVAVAYYAHTINNDYHTLQSDKAWSSWPQAQPLRMKGAPYDAQYAQELVQEIQMRYLALHDIADFMKPIQNFMQDIDAERRALQHYEQRAQLLQRYGLYRFVDMQLFAETQTRIERLDLLRAYCLQWLARAKLGQF